jgi:hypothetical protein
LAQQSPQIVSSGDQIRDRVLVENPDECSCGLREYARETACANDEAAVTVEQVVQFFSVTYQLAKIYFLGATGQTYSSIPSPRSSKKFGGRQILDDLHQMVLGNGKGL